MDLSDKVTLLRAVTLLQGLGAQSLIDLARYTQVRPLRRGTPVVQRGDVRRSLYFLFSGRCQVVDATADGNEVGMGFIDAGDYFGELTVIDGLPRSASVVSTTLSMVGELAAQQSQELLRSQPSVSDQIMCRLATKVRQASELRVILSVHSAPQRVCAAMEHLARPTLIPGVDRVFNLPSQRELAILVNTSRETVSRVINRLVQRGMVAKCGRQLHILQTAKLLWED